MRCVVQRVSSASVVSEGREVARIGLGLVVLAGIARGDGPDDIRWMARKIANLRIFGDDEGKLNRSVLEAGGQVLLVSNFTVCGDASKGRRPDFTDAAPFDRGERLFAMFADALREEGATVQTGVFGAMMSVNLVNEGPVTIVVESPVK
ncbi:MAG: D-tyrosyl-tRNA(Tyr) deacylase [Armatimonadetes bacterium]|nr:MAG: D-tyrosyl-tRNA(Tyr) deacylase [Armatimonadota bacterium]